MLVNPHTWLEDVITRVGPQGNFLAERSTRDAVTEGEWYISKLGFHDTFEYWVNQGRPTLLEEVRRKIRQILHQHQPLPLDETTDHELCKLEARVRKLSPRDEGQKVIN
jgi:trimethylamine:corrinoid methyltransferase-like protein